MYKLPKFSKLPGLLHAFSDKSDGNMAVRFGQAEEVYQNRENFLKELGTEGRRAVLMEIQHGTDIVFVDEGDGGKGVLPDVAGYKADALIAAEDGIFPFLLIGDCLPIVVYDPKMKVLGLAHLGWRNTDKRFIQLVIEKMKKECGTNPPDLFIGIGPAIHKGSYLLSGAEIAERKLDWPGFINPVVKNKFGLDLVGYNLAQIKEMGVVSGRIEMSRIDTAASKKYFSHYRSARNIGEKEGRIAAVAGMVWE
ncbi:MAG: laccase domain-containing protein [Candidatus Liptonbacteria bacterium]